MLKKLPMAGARILHVEDELLIALEVESICLDSGAQSVTHFGDLKEADGADLGSFDLALLDLTLHDRSTLELASRLEAAGVPLVFISGQDRSAVDQAFPAARFLDKPFSTAGLTAVIIDSLGEKPLRAA